MYKGAFSCQLSVVRKKTGHGVSDGAMAMVMKDYELACDASPSSLAWNLPSTFRLVYSFMKSGFFKRIGNPFS